MERSLAASPGPLTSLETSAVTRFCCSVFLSTLFLVLAAGNSSRAETPASVDSLLRYLPGEANVLVILKVEDIIQSPRGTREGWAKKQEAAFLGGAESLPPWVNIAVRGAEFRIEDGSLGSSLGFVTTDHEISLERIAQHEKAKIQTIAGRPVIHSARNSYFTLIDEHTLGIVSPAYRQEMARWIHRLSAGPRVELCEYLQTAAKENRDHVLLAIDAADMLAPERVDAWMKSAPSLARHRAEVAPLIKLFSGLRGIRFSASVDEVTSATITLEFLADVGNRGDLVKGVFLDFLDDSSAVLEDFQQAKVSVRGNKVLLRTNLSDSGLKRVLSLVTSPTPGGGQSSKSTPGTTSPTTPPAPAADPELEASRKYYVAVNQLVDDLSNRSQRAKYPEKTAVWHDNYAKKIEQMSISGIDPQLAKYGLSVASRLRALGASLRGVPLQIDNLQDSVTYNMTVNPGNVGFGYWGGGSFSAPSWQVNSNLQQVREKVWASLENDRQSIRQKMLTTYHVDFETSIKK